MWNLNEWLLIVCLESHPWSSGWGISICLPFSVQFSHSVVSDSLRPMDHSMPGLPVHHQLPEFTQTHIHRVPEAIQPSHPLSSPSPPGPNPLPASESFPMGQLFTWGGQSTGVSASASFLPKKSQGWSPSEWISCQPVIYDSYSLALCY